MATFRHLLHEASDRIRRTVRRRPPRSGDSMTAIQTLDVSPVDVEIASWARTGLPVVQEQKSSLCLSCSQILMDVYEFENDHERPDIILDCTPPCEHSKFKGMRKPDLDSSCFLCQRVSWALQTHSIDEVELEVTLRHLWTYSVIDFRCRPDPGRDNFVVWMSADILWSPQPSRIENGHVPGSLLGQQWNTYHGQETSDHVSSLSTTTASRQSIQQAKRWLKTCCDNHISCQPDRTAPVSLPSRLLLLSRHAKGVSISLKDTKEFDPNEAPPYLTLSHCWGEVQSSVTLTTNNLISLQESIPLGQLSKCFQHAVIVTLELGYKFLWIDCLCIIQDSSEDKALEIPRMAEVYGNSACNIAATGFRDGTTGLFTTGGVRGSVSETRLLPKGSLTLNFSQSWDDFIRSSPLLHRAWVFQEIFLAKRIIHFTQHQLYWQCDEERCSESHPSHIQGWNSGPYAFNTAGPMISWMTFIAAYSMTNIRFTNDIFPAVAGMAAKFREYLAGEYIAGSWLTFNKIDFLRQLTWRVPEGYTSRFPTIRRAPSWSWAALEISGLQWDHDEYPLGGFASSSLAVLEGTDPSNETIILTAPLLPITIPLLPISIKGVYESESREFFGELPTLRSHDVAQDGSSLSQSLTVTLDLTDYVRDIDSHSVLGLPLTYRHAADHYVVVGLIIHNTLPATAQFRRVGFFKYRCYDPNEEYFRCRSVDNRTSNTTLAASTHLSHGTLDGLHETSEDVNQFDVSKLCWSDEEYDSLSIRWNGFTDCFGVSRMYRITLE